MKKVILGIVLINQLVIGMDLPTTSSGEQERRSNLRETTVAQLSINDLQDMIRDSVKMAVIANTQEFREAVNEVSSQLKEALNQRINFQAMNFQTVLERKEEEHKREKEILEAKLAEKEKSCELRGILLKINVNDRTPISDKAENIQQLEVLERHVRTESIYKRCLAFNELIGRTDLGVSATQEDLDAVHNYVKNTAVMAPVKPVEKPASNAPRRDWVIWFRELGGYDKYRSKSREFTCSIEGPSQGVDWLFFVCNRRAAEAYDNQMNEYNKQLSMYHERIKNAEAVKFPTEEFDRLVSDVNRFFTEGLH